MDATRRALQGRIAAAGLAALLALAFSACKSSEPARQRVTPEDDARITARIKARLAADGDITPFSIEVTTYQGVVTLEGRVKRDELKVRAERYASETDGVVRVINLVKVGDIR
jgi:hyperosmotically inducible periplasmic protein